MTLMRGIAAPSPDALQEYRVNQANEQEIIWQPMYDYLDYAQAGQQVLTYFANPQGQNGKTANDTNMDLAAQLPDPQEFLVTSVHVDILPAALPGRVATAATLIATNINDVYEVLREGWLEFKIGSKVYIQEGPLGKFPPTYRFQGMGALALAGEAADKAGIIDYAQSVGEYYEVLPFAIPSSQNFKVTLNWDAAVAITEQCRIGVTLGGFLYRSVQ